jgi:hypothetical protein
MHMGGHLRKANLKQVKLITKENGIINEARGRKNRPAMESTELREGEILRVVMGKVDEGARRCVPKGTKEVGQVAVGEGKRTERKGKERERE